VVSVQATFSATVVDEWVRHGLRHAVVCPGSRSTPLALALAAREEIAVHVRLDERGAGFFAVGLGSRSGSPVVVLTTSGTASVELHPAVVEAHHGRVPLIACTADRPPELHHVGAPQTIEQGSIFGPAVRWSCDPGVADASASATWRHLARRAWEEACHGPFGPGPVHLNLAFRDPLVGEPDPLPETLGAPALPKAANAPVGVGVDISGWPAMRGIVVAGAGCGPPDRVLALSDQLGWPVLADPRSSCRRPSRMVVAAADALARSARFRRLLLPEIVLVLGAPWASKALSGLLIEAAAAGAPVVAVDPWWQWTDPDGIVTSTVRATPGAWLAAAVATLTGSAAGPHALGWTEAWQECEKVAQDAIDAVLAEEPEPMSEPLLARRLLPLLAPDTCVVASSSMPVRTLEWFAPVMDEPPPVMANRGANGIDGVISTAQGVAAAGLGPVVGFVGDLAFFHDVSSLLRPVGAPTVNGCTLVVVDNGGGGIFNFLPQASMLSADRFEQLFGTPQANDVASVATGFGLDVADVGTLGELDAALRAVRRSRLAVVRVRVPDRRANVVLFDRIHRAVEEAVDRVL